MPVIHTAKDLGLAIRARRKALNWDQATLAKQVGVTRQWVIDIEKGKPRAELALAMRAVRVLGLSLNLEVTSESAESRSESQTNRGGRIGAPYLDIKAIVESNRVGAASSLAELAASALPKTAADYLEEIEAVRRQELLSSVSAAGSASEFLNRATSIQSLAELVAPALPKTAAEEALEAMRQQDRLSNINATGAVSELLDDFTSVRKR